MRPALELHFVSLGTQERRLRFGVPLNDSALRGYVARIDFERDALFGFCDDGTQYGETDAWLKLPPADAATHFGEVFEQRAALFDYALKRGRAWLSPGK